jgi:hypothetical protein
MMDFTTVNKNLKPLAEASRVTLAPMCGPEART